MEHDVTENRIKAEQQPSRRGGLKTVALIAAGIMAGITLAGFGVASAKGDGPQSPQSPQSANSAAGGQSAGGQPAGALRRFGGGQGQPGRPEGLGNMLHGEGVVRRGEGEGVLETVAMQSGKVTAVSDTSIKVESTDGFTRTYAVTADTKLLPRGSGIGDVDEGDEVRVFAVVDGDTATAKRIMNITDRPERPGGPTGPPDGALLGI